MTQLLIVYHSRTGGARRMAEAAARGAKGEAEVRLVQAADATPEDMLAAQGYIFACPENLAALSGVMKDFFDRCYYPVLDQINGRPYMQMICAGSDGEGAVRQLTRIVTGWRLKAVAEPLIVLTHAQTAEAIAREKQIPELDLSRCADAGAAMAAGLAMGVF